MSDIGAALPALSSVSLAGQYRGSGQTICRQRFRDITSAALANFLSSLSRSLCADDDALSRSARRHDETGHDTEAIRLLLSSLPSDDAHEFHV